MCHDSWAKQRASVVAKTISSCDLRLYRLKNMVKTLVPICPNGLVGKLGQCYFVRAWGLGMKYTNGSVPWMNEWIWTGQWIGLIALFPNPSLHTWLPSYSQSLVEYLKPKSLGFFCWFLANFHIVAMGKKKLKKIAIFWGNKKRSSIAIFRQWIPYW
jgi:hypothetical protein